MVLTCVRFTRRERITKYFTDMELTKLMAELATLTPNGVLLTNVYFIDGKWQNVMVKVTDYKSNKELVVVIDNGDEQKSMEQVMQLHRILNGL